MHLEQFHSEPLTCNWKNKVNNDTEETQPPFPRNQSVVHSVLGKSSADI